MRARGLLSGLFVHILEDGRKGALGFFYFKTVKVSGGVMSV